MQYETPQGWKSPLWWRSRPTDERLYHATIAPRVLRKLEEETPVLPPMPEAGIFLRGPQRSLVAGAMLQQAIRSGKSGRWVGADPYIDMIKDSFGTEDGLLPESYSTPNLLKYLKGVWDVVVLDGLGEERNTEFARHELGSLIRLRYDKCLPTIITTDLKVDELNLRYGEQRGRLTEVVEDFTEYMCAPEQEQPYRRKRGER